VGDEKQGGKASAGAPKRYCKLVHGLAGALMLRQPHALAHSGDINALRVA
jgi:hypothetical protein